MGVKKMFDDESLMAASLESPPGPGDTEEESVFRARPPRRRHLTRRTAFA